MHQIPSAVYMLEHKVITLPSKQATPNYSKARPILPDDHRAVGHLDSSPNLQAKIGLVW